MPPKSTIPKLYKKKSQPSKTNTNTYTSSPRNFLVIVESPSKCKKIEEYLGSEYQCIASKGHLRTIDSLKSIDTKHNYSISFQTIEEKKGHIEHMRQIIQQYSPDKILLASDDDREGEAIAWHICCLFNLPVSTTKRIKFHEITKPALIESIASPTIINMPLVYAQHARQVLDILVGFTISPVLWKHIHFNKTNALSAGRCQTPTLRLIYDNYLENRQKEKEFSYKTVGYFFEKNIPFILNHEYSTEEEIQDYLAKSQKHSHQLSFSETKETFQSSPRPFTTSKLLQAASNIYHYNPKTTMDLCQQLYQSGHITYMRTDSPRYSPIFLEKCKTFIISEYGKQDYLGDFSKIVNSDSSNPHEAIRVTNLGMKSLSSENRSLVAMYRLIWRNTVESCMAPAKYNTTAAYISTHTPHRYEHKVDVPLFLGWKIVGGEEKDLGESQNSSAGLLFFMKSLEKSPVNYSYIDCTTSIKNKSSHYTEAGLIQKLEELGIGRPSTFATIVDTNVERGYVKKQDIAGEKIICTDMKLRRGSSQILRETKERIIGAEKNKLVIQPTGIVCIEFLVEHFSTFFSYDYTKTMEEQLDITSTDANAEHIWFNICKNCHQEIKTLIKPISKMEKQTYKVGEYTLAFHSFGASLCKVGEDGKKEYQNVRKDVQIDLEKLKREEYTLEELSEKTNEYLGDFNESPVLLKNGRYGLYLENGEKKISLKTLKIPMDKITLADVMPFLSSEGGVVTGENIINKSILRVLTKEVSIRKGKYGAYIFYQREGTKTPEFFSMKGFKEGFATCNSEDLIEWIRETHKLNIY